MKKVLLIMAFLGCAFMVKAQEKVLFGKLPREAQEFVQTNFKKFNVQQVEMNRQDKDEKYTVLFKGDNSIVFDNRGNWMEIRMQTEPVPDTVIPAAIQTNVSGTYPGQRIMLMTQTDNGYMAKLSNGTDLYYDKSGNIVRTR